MIISTFRLFLDQRRGKINEKNRFFSVNFKKKTAKTSTFDWVKSPYGNTIDHDSTFKLKPKEELNIQTTYVEHMSNLLKIQEKIIKIAQDSQESVDKHNITKRGN